MLSLRTIPRSLVRFTIVPRVAPTLYPPSSASVLRFYSTPTQSEEAAKADAYHKHHDKEQMQKETVDGHTHERRADKISASPNDTPTESEDVAHATKSDKSPEELQQETAKKFAGHSH